MLIDELQSGGLYEKILESRRLSKRDQDRWTEIREAYGLDAGGHCRTQGQLAKCLGVSRQTINRWKNDEACPMPVESDGHYNPVLVYAWSLNFNPNQSSEDAKTPERSRWDTQAAKYKALKSELEYRRMAGELIERDEVEGLFVSRITALRISLQAWSRRLGLRLADKPADQVMDILDDEVRLLMETYSRPLNITDNDVFVEE